MVATRRSLRLRGSTPLVQAPEPLHSKSPSKTWPTPAKLDSVIEEKSKTTGPATISDTGSSTAENLQGLSNCQSVNAMLDSLPSTPTIDPSLSVKPNGTCGRALRPGMTIPSPSRSKRTTPNFLVDYDFSFNAKASIDSRLSADARRIMDETREEAAKIRAKMVAAKERQDALDRQAEDMPVFGLPSTPSRKIANPKGRFSDAHKRQFDRMDSIANHPSVFRFAAQARETQQVTASPSTPKSLKRQRSFIDPAGDGNLRRLTSPSKLNFTPIPKRDYEPNSAKRVRRDEGTLENTILAKPHALEDKKKALSASSMSKKPDIPPVSTVALTDPFTPKKASLIRSQSTQSMKFVRTPNSFAKSPSSRTVVGRFNDIRPEPKSPSPTKVRQQRSIGKTPTVSSLKSILRHAPSRLYSNDPAKIAAGTHVPVSVGRSAIPQAPATAPVRKHVDFTASVKNEDGCWPQFSLLSKLHHSAKTSDSKQLPGTVTYPALPPFYPDLDSTIRVVEHSDFESSERPKAVPKSQRRQTAGALEGLKHSTSMKTSAFTFRSKVPGPAFGKMTTTPTIRRVRPSDAPAVSTTPGATKKNFVASMPSKKRKLEDVDNDADATDKENQPEHQVRKTSPRMQKNTPKRVKTDSVERPSSRVTTPAKVTSTPGKRYNQSPQKSGGLSMARLALLATPKRRG